jgi:hypothetical protein
VILATTLAAFVSQPIGLQVQEKITTSADVQRAHFAAARKEKIGKIDYYHVDIEWDGDGPQG